MNPIPLTHGQSQVITLLADSAIDTAGWGQPEEIAFLPDGLEVIRNVVQPSLTAYLPDPAIATGMAVIVSPGGAFRSLAFEHEGTEVIKDKRIFVSIMNAGVNFPQKGLGNTWQS